MTLSPIWTPSLTDFIKISSIEFGGIYFFMLVPIKKTGDSALVLVSLSGKNIYLVDE